MSEQDDLDNAAKAYWAFYGGTGGATNSAQPPAGYSRHSQQDDMMAHIHAYAQLLAARQHVQDVAEAPPAQGWTDEQGMAISGLMGGEASQVSSDIQDPATGDLALAAAGQKKEAQLAGRHSPALMAPSSPASVGFPPDYWEGLKSGKYKQ